MAVSIQWVRDGEPIPHRWGFWHVLVFQDAACISAGVDLDKFRETELYAKGEQAMRYPLTFVDSSDGEVFQLEAGDVLRMWG